MWLLILASQLVFSTVCADPVSHSDIRDTSQSFTSACSCSPRLRCQTWLKLTEENAMNSESIHKYTNIHIDVHSPDKRAGIMLLCCSTPHMFTLNGTRCARFERKTIFLLFIWYIIFNKRFLLYMYKYEKLTQDEIVVGVCIVEDLLTIIVI